MMKWERASPKLGQRVIAEEVSKLPHSTAATTAANVSNLVTISVLVFLSVFFPLALAFLVLVGGLFALRLVHVLLHSVAVVAFVFSVSEDR